MKKGEYEAPKIGIVEMFEEVIKTSNTYEKGDDTAKDIFA